MCAEKQDELVPQSPLAMWQSINRFSFEKGLLSLRHLKPPEAYLDARVSRLVKGGGRGDSLILEIIRRKP